VKPVAARPDRGSASIWVLAAGLVFVPFATTVVLAGSAAIARHRAQSAADLGALAGAVEVVVDPSGACGAAAVVVADNGAAMTACRVDALDIIVAASVPVAGAIAGIGPAVAVARAGPVRTILADGQTAVTASVAVDAVANAASTASKTRTASAFASGSFPLPHFGDCTHDGQPRSQPHDVMAVRVAVNHSEAT
jgi:secretion/DNA translocation related TadE-like protein